MAIKNIQELRDHMIKVLEKLEAGDIETEDAEVSAKVCDSITTTIKLEMAHAKMINKDTKIGFLEDSSGYIIEGEKAPLKLGNSK